MDTDAQLHFSRDDLLTATDVARILRTTALDYMRRGVVPARKIGAAGTHRGHFWTAISIASSSSTLPGRY
jgi:hypothetical protein